MTKTMKVEGPLHVVCQCDKCKAQPEQEPVAWMSPHIKDRDGDWVYGFSMYRDDYYMFPVYNAPPQCTWVDLTDDEIDQGLLHSNYAMQTAGAWRDGVEWATKQLKEKNT